MTNSIQILIEHLQQNSPVVLATILTRNGSTPRTAGAKMLIFPDGSIEGTIGGGLMEAQSIELGLQLHYDHLAMVTEFRMTGKDAASSDMICGGNQEVLLEYLDPQDQSLIPAFEAMSTSMKERKNAWWITLLPQPGVKIARLPHTLITANGQSFRCGEWADPNDLTTETGLTDTVKSSFPTFKIGQNQIDLSEIREARLITQGEVRYSIDPVSNYGTVYIFGCGHVSQKLAALTVPVGFRTVVLDDRREYASQERFPGADKVIVLDSFAHSLNQITLDPQSYIVIVTRGHLDDQVVLEQALHSNAVYIGMIGSKRKCETIYRALVSEGFSRVDLQKVHAPIGLPIDAESPEEIAVSITAELIQARAKLLKTGLT